MSDLAFYRCESCGNLVALLNKGGGTLTCCDQPMKLLKANSTDAAQEKHVPVFVHEDGKLKVTVGATPHPMLPEHYIQWIALVSGNNVEFRVLKPGDAPKAEFNDVRDGEVYAYCNLHSLWKASV